MRWTIGAGTPIAGRFELVRFARSGGMGDVFLANDRLEGGPVALKVLSTSNGSIVERFLREAEILAELDHPAIVRHVAHGVDEGVPYLAMGWVEGLTLSERLNLQTRTVKSRVGHDVDPFFSAGGLALACPW